MTSNGSTNKMPALVVGAVFFIVLTNPYKLVHKAFRDRPSQDKMAELSWRLVVNTGALHFVRFQIFFFPHLLYAWVHQGMVWLEFLEAVVKECGKLKWFENDSHTTRQRLMGQSQ